MFATPDFTDRGAWLAGSSGMTTTQILAIQATALETSNNSLYLLTWTALGYDRRVAFMQVTAGERNAAIAKLKELHS